jgi:hypothetical protein
LSYICIDTKTMNLNIISYGIYGILTYYITVHVGWLCYKHGIHYLKEEIQDDKIAVTINNILLVGYYLLNLGYALLKISRWPAMGSVLDVVETVGYRVGGIVMMLGCMHVTNMFLIYLLRKKTNRDKR